METIRIKYANVILDIREDEKEKYLSKGYSVIDKITGEVLEEGDIKDIGVLKVTLEELRAQVIEKDKLINKLTAENKKLKKKGAEVTADEVPTDTPNPKAE